jgi:hypothetical protein
MDGKSLSVCVLVTPRYSTFSDEEGEAGILDGFENVNFGSMSGLRSSSTGDLDEPRCTLAYLCGGDLESIMHYEEVLNPLES